MAPRHEEAQDAERSLITAGETAPLLGHADHEQDEQQRNSSSRFFTKRVSALSLSAYVCFCICLEFGMYMTAAPLHQVLEAIICSRHASSTTEDCKPDGETKRRLMMLLAWYQTFLLIPILLMLLPWGLMADRYGQRVVLVLGALGMLLTNAWVRIVCKFPLLLLFFLFFLE